MSWWSVNSWFWRNVWDLTTRPAPEEKKLWARMSACLHACTEKAHFCKIPMGEYRLELGKDARLELERCRGNFRGDLLVWGRWYHHDGIERNAAGDADLSRGRGDGGGICLYSVHNFRARKREGKKIAATSLLLQWLILQPFGLLTIKDVMETLKSYWTLLALGPDVQESTLQPPWYSASLECSHAAMSECALFSRGERRRVLLFGLRFEQRAITMQGGGGGGGSEVP